MTSKRRLTKAFLKLDLGFKKDEIEEFLQSIPKAIKLLFAIEEADKNSQSIVRDTLMAELMALNDEFQWPILRKIRDSNLVLYDGIDEETVSAFISSITDELELRLPSNMADPREKWEYLRIRIKDRINLYRERFDLDEKEIEKFKKKGIEFFKEKLGKRKSPIHKVLTVTAVVGVVAGGTYMLLKKKKEDNNK